MHHKKCFSFEWQKNGFTKIEFNYDVTIPLDDEDVCELIAMLCATHNIPCYVQDDLRYQFSEFVKRETAEFYDNEGAEAIEKFRNLTEDQQQEVVEDWIDHFEKHYTSFSLSKPTSTDESFQNVYQALVNGTCPGAIQKILNKERTLSSEIQKLVRARDWEVERLKREHTNVINQAVEELNVASPDQKVSMIASRHFEKIHLVESNYESQLTTLAESQKREFRNFVLKLHEEEVLKEQGVHSSETADSANRLPANGQISPRRHQDSVTAGAAREESFTIYLGAQLKTMHNLRLTAVDSMQLCKRKVGSGGIVEDSLRLQMALSLYGNELHGLVLLVDSRPSYHINFRTDFARACEQSTELHFNRLENQLENVEKEVIKANEWRLMKTVEHSHDWNGSNGSCPPMSSTISETLSTGDVYVTKHSNLAQVHVVYHMVIDEVIKSQEMNSRHPCINGLRNIIRLCSKFGVSTVSIPLLLIESMNEELTVAWCLKRAELVFKCVKGFLMEAAALSCGSDNNDTSRQQHYTVQFVVPPEISNETYAQISEMLPTIFHLVRPVMAE